MNHETIIRNILTAMQVEVESITETSLLDKPVFSVKTKENLIGYHADILHALNSITKRIAEKNGIDTHFLVDVNEHHSRQIHDLEDTARTLAERARTLKYDVEMAPMSAYERLIVHTVLQKEPNIKTESRGFGDKRRLVIKFVE